MDHLLPAWPLLWAFLLAAVVLAITPGPGVIFIVTRSLAHGRRSGLASVAGVALGNLCNAVGAALGLAALFALSSAAFVVVKIAGALYLLHLGVQALRGAGGGAPAADLPRASLRRIFRDGFLVALLNPKITLFFAAFLPQFMDGGAPAAAQSVALGGLFVVIAATTDTIYALGAGLIAPRLARATRLRPVARLFTGSTFIGLGLFAALSGGRSGK